MYKSVDIRSADSISYFLNLQWNLTETKLFHFRTIFKNGRQEGQFPAPSGSATAIENIFLSFKHLFWVLKRTYSLRQFFWVSAVYVLIDKEQIWFLITYSYLEACKL